MTRCLTNQPIRLRVNARQRRERKLAEQNWKALKTLPFRARFYQWIRNYTFKVADGIVASNIKKKNFFHFSIFRRHARSIFSTPFSFMMGSLWLYACVCRGLFHFRRGGKMLCSQNWEHLSFIGERVYGFFFGRRHVWIS